MENCRKREYNNQQARNRGQEFTQPRGSSQSYHEQTRPSTSRDPPQLRTIRYLQPEDSDNRPKGIATALINRDAPTIQINSEDLTQPISLMIDTGASLNLIKIGRVAPHVEIDRSRVVQIRGITKTYVDTLGKVQLRVMGSNIDFHLVDNEFPIEDDGLIGNEFFLTRNADVSYSEQCLKWDGHKIPFMEVETVKIPARTKGSFFVRVQNFEATEGYVPRQQVADGIFLGDALVTNNNGKAYLYLTNTTEKDIEVAVPVITIEPYEELLNTNSGEDLYIDSLTEPVQENNQTKSNTESFDGQSQSQNLIHQMYCNETMEPTEPQTPDSSHYPTSQSTLPSNSYNLQITEPRLDEKLSHQNHGILSENLSEYDQYLEPCKENFQLQGKELDEAVLEFQGINKIVQEITDLEKTLYSTRTSLEKNQVPFPIYSLKDRVAEIKKLLRLDHLNQEEKKSVDRHLNEFQDRYHLPNEKLMATSVMRHRINTTDERPINTRQYRYPPVLKEEINRQVETLLDDGIIQPLQSAYNSPVWIVPKKADSKGIKKWRMVLDYRALNEKTISDAYPLPFITEILDQLGGAIYFSTFDLASGFHQIEMHPEDKHKTAFSTPFGHYEFLRMPFGLRNAPATFQRLMDQVLTGIQGTDAFIYLDDIVIYGSSLEEHELKLERLMKRLREAQL